MQPHETYNPGTPQSSGGSTGRAMEDGARSESAERLRAIFDTAVEGIITISDRGIIESFNNAAEKLFGYTREEVIGKNIKMLMPSPYREEHDGYLQNYLSTGQAKIIGIGREVRGQRKDGSIFPMKLAVSEVRLADRVLFTGFVEDLTERKRYEEALKESVERMRAIFDTAVEGIITISDHGIIETFNPAAEQLFGYPREEVIGRNINTLMPSPYREEHDGYLVNYLRTGKAKIIGVGREVVGLRKNRTTFPMKLAVSEVRLADRVLFTGFVEDLTERKRYEEALKESVERMRAIFDTAVEGIITISDHGIIETFNPAAEQLFGYARREVVGKNIKMLMPSPYREEHDGYLFNYLRTGKAKIIGIGREVIGLRKNGTTFPMKLAVSEVRLADRLLFTGFVEDLTERKRAEEELRRWNAELENRVADRTRELEERADQLHNLAVELTRAEGRERLRLAQALHDDLQQILVAAKFNIAGLLPRVPEDPCRTGLRQIEKLLQQAIDTSRALTGELVSPPALTEMGLISALRWLSRTTKEKHGLEVVVRSDDGPDGLSEDLRLLAYSILRELLFNVVKHSGARSAEIDIQRETDGLLRITVSDKGRGFDPGMLKTREDPHGGFGLPSIRDRLTAVGGELMVESSPGQGARMQVVLPMVAEHGPEADRS